MDRIRWRFADWEPRAVWQRALWYPAKAGERIILNPPQRYLWHLEVLPVRCLTSREDVLPPWLEVGTPLYSIPHTTVGWVATYADVLSGHCFWPPMHGLAETFN